MQSRERFVRRVTLSCHTVKALADIAPNPRSSCRACEAASEAEGLAPWATRFISHSTSAGLASAAQPDAASRARQLLQDFFGQCFDLLLALGLIQLRMRIERRPLRMRAGLVQGFG